MSSDPLKVLMAIQYYVPHRTGVTLHVQRVAEALATRGHEVTVLSARYHPSLPRDEQTINGVRVIRLWAPLRVTRGMVMPAYPWAAFRLVQMADVVSLHTPTLETAIYAVYTRLMKRGLLITHHGDLILPAGAFNRFVEWFTFLLYRMAGRAAQHIIAYSEDYADHSYYVAPFRSKTVAVHPPIDIPAPDPQRVEELRAGWLAGANGQARLIGYAGRFVEEKRPDVLIRALPTIHQKYPGTKIVFAGQYDIRYEHFYERNLPLTDAFREHLVFLGLLDDPQELANFFERRHAAEVEPVAGQRTGTRTSRFLGHDESALGPRFRAGQFIRANFGSDVAKLGEQYIERFLSPFGCRPGIAEHTSRAGGCVERC